ncbi:DUF2142 domain-containing protein [Actinomyces bowdenii]|uniref:DUF2142 domain-containing protein n=1 Tax=Actinomyces bowdenii TaxID=131109 RepID=UPI00214C6A91|nr:DUF2142 domain-containing protein [Actinomyces bowdenii]
MTESPENPETTESPESTVHDSATATAEPSSTADSPGPARTALRRLAATHGPQHRSGPRADRRRAGSRWALGLVLAAAVLATGLSWVVASPVGGSPDDDFHLGSIWCPRPVSSSGCATREHNGEVQVLVPSRVSETARCYAFHDDVPASCQGAVPEDSEIYSRRYDDGNYPKGYYRFHHLLIGDDVDVSALTMRAVNLLIAVGLLGAIGGAMPARLREQYSLAIILAWMPMGLYLVASNNPSSWALTGVLGYAAGMYGSLRSSRGRRRWVLLGLALVGALLACACRGDSAFYLLVVSLALFIGLTWRRRVLLQAAVAAVVSAIGAWMMLGSGQSQAVVSSEPTSALSNGTRLKLIILTIPEYFGGFYGGERWGAGWFDVPLDGPIAVMALGLAGIALFIGARTVGWRKLLSAGVLAGALVCLPAALSYTQGFESNYELQPRYLLPLLAPFFLVWLRQRSGERILSTPQAVLIVGLSSLAHAYALHRILLRYTHGLVNLGKDAAGWLPINLDFQPQWWWDIPISPMGVWMIGSLMYAVALVAALLLARRLGALGQEGPVEPTGPKEDGGQGRRTGVPAAGAPVMADPVAGGAAAAGPADDPAVAGSVAADSAGRAPAHGDGGAGSSSQGGGPVEAEDRPVEPGEWADIEPQWDPMVIDPTTADSGPASPTSVSSAACAAGAAG